MKNLKRKSIAFLTISSFILGPALFFSPIQVSAKSKPTIKEVRKRQENSIRLPVKYEKYASKKVRIKIRVKNLNTGEVWETRHNRRLNSEGRVNITAKNLAPGTVYKFKTKIKKQNSSHYSDWSDSRKGSTRWMGL